MVTHPDLCLFFLYARDEKRRKKKDITNMFENLCLGGGGPDSVIVHVLLAYVVCVCKYAKDALVSNIPLRKARERGQCLNPCAGISPIHS